MKIVEFMDQKLPSWVANGNHSQYIIPFAKQVCIGNGLDIGYGREDWKFPGAIGVDPAIDPRFDAHYLPYNPEKWDYIFSSHCLEHIEDWESALFGWHDTLKKGGILFLYLPHPDCLYWRPDLMPTKKHINSFTPDQMQKELENLGMDNIFVSQRDLAWSFAAIGEKQ